MPNTALPDLAPLDLFDPDAPGSGTVAHADADAGASGAAPFDPALFPDVVYLLPLSEAADGDAGTAESFPDPSGPGLPCTVSAERVLRQGWAGDQEIGITPIKIALPDDPGARKGDQLLWLGRRIRLLAPARPELGTGSLWLAEGEIRD